MKEIVAAAELEIGMFVAELDRPWLDSPFLMQGFLLEDEATRAQVQGLCRFVYVDRQRSTGEHYRAPVREQVASTVGASLAGAPRVRSAEAMPPAREFVDVLRWLRGGGQVPAARQVHAAEARADYVAAAHDAPPAPAGEEAHRPGLRNWLGRWFGPRGEAPSPGHETTAPDADATEAAEAAEAGRAESVAVEDELVEALPAYAGTQAAVDQLISDVQHNLRPDMERVRSGIDDMMHSVTRNPDALLWLTRLKRTDRYAYDHALDVSVLLMVFARSLGMEAVEMSLLGTAGLMQDIGKLRLPPRLLKKAGRITPLEREIFRTHVDYSLAILEEAGEDDAQLREIVARHHERFDGSGYPSALAGDAIGLYGQMAGITDTYCAMTRERPWGDALSPQQALEKINHLRGVWFSASVTDAFIQCVGLYPVGTLVELNTDEVAVVIAQNRVRRLKPRLLVLLAPDGSPNPHPPTLDLLYEPSAPDGTPYAIRRALPPGARGIDPQEFYLG